MHEIPPALEEMQIWFATNLTRPFRETGKFNLPVYSEPLAQEIGKRITSGPHLNAEQRFGLYNQQYWWRLFVLLQEAYPSLVRLFGYRDFNTLIAEPYLLRFPPDHWFLPRLGDRLVQWLQEEYREDDRELLIQAAQVDEAFERLFHEGNKPVPTPESFTEKLYLQPTISLFALTADFFSFRAKLLEHDVAYWQKCDLPDLDNSKGKYYFVLYQTNEGLLQEEIKAPQHKLLSAFQNGALLSEACGLADPACADFIGDWFKTWIERGFFAIIRDI